MLTQSIRPFIGSKNYETSRAFYRFIGFEELVIGKSMSLFCLGSVQFYLQDYYQEGWVNNSMIFLEVENLDEFYLKLNQLEIKTHFPEVVLKPIMQRDWGKEFFLHDPSNILWHIGSFD